MTGPNRKNSRPKSRNGAPGFKGAKKGGQNFNNKQGRPVSSNYTVDLFHHQLAGMTQQRQPQQQQQPAPGGKPAPQQRKGPPRHPAAKKGYTVHSFEIKDQLYKEFTAKLKNSSKTPKEVINQLISFFNMGKIKI